MLTSNDSPAYKHSAGAQARMPSAVEVELTAVGENGHLAFNDPPADFDTDEPYLVVNLDEAYRQQQVGEGRRTNA